MSENQIIIKIKELKQLESLIEDASNEAEEIKKMLKAEMNLQKVSEMQVGEYLMRYTDVISNRFDTTSFKKKYGELYKAFTKAISSKRFSIV